MKMSENKSIILEKHFEVNVLRDDLICGGTKSVFMPKIIDESIEYVYASPVYGGFQICLSSYCKSVGKKATIFCAKRKQKHINTLKCLEYGANIIEIDYGYLSVIEKRATEYANKYGAKKIVFGAKDFENKIILANRVKSVIEKLGKEPEEIWCAIGSGTLVESILIATEKCKIFGVQVGKEYENFNERLTIIKYPKKFEVESKFYSGFNSMPNYDLKAFEICVKNKKSKDVLFWNVM